MTKVNINTKVETKTILMKDMQMGDYGIIGRNDYKMYEGALIIRAWNECILLHNGDTFSSLESNTLPIIPVDEVNITVNHGGAGTTL